MIGPGDGILKFWGKLTNEQISSLVNIYNEGVPLEVLSRSFNISKGYASDVGRSGRIVSKKRGGVKNIKMTSLASKVLFQELTKDPKKTGAELAKALEASDVKVKASTVNKHLSSGAMAKHGCPSFTFKRLVSHPEERNSSETLTARVKYVNKYLYYKNRGTVFIFIDVTKFNATDF